MLSLSLDVHLSLPVLIYYSKMALSLIKTRSKLSIEDSLRF